MFYNYNISVIPVKSTPNTLIYTKLTNKNCMKYLITITLLALLLTNCAPPVKLIAETRVTKTYKKGKQTCKTRYNPNTGREYYNCFGMRDKYKR